jgi:phospholipase/lecithinase/hemolysin
MVAYCMRKSSVLQWTLAVLITIALAAPTAVAGEMSFKSIVVFGDSLSDPGNDFALINTQNTPPYDGLDEVTIIPHAPYAKGGHHYSNGATWVEQFAKRRGLAQYVTPAWQSAGTKAANYAVGGGRAYDDHINKNLPQQVLRFLGDVGYQASPDALYVIEFGGNDLRDALVVAASGGDTTLFIRGSLQSVVDNIGLLYAYGARKFLVWNAPDLSLTPAIIALGYQVPVFQLVEGYNAGLDAYLAALSGMPGIDIEIKRFDAAAAVRGLVTVPEAYGLDVVNAACVTPKSPPFDCKEPDEYLFWDGIHPTKTAHGIFAQMVADLLVQ